MSIEYFSLGLLTVLLIGSNVFWARLLFSMSDRLMSRNYFDFAQTEKILKNQVARAEVADGDEMRPDPEDVRQARELNSIMGIA